MLQARINRVVYGARQPRLGADGSWVSLFGSAGRISVNEGSGSAGDSLDGASLSSYDQLPIIPHPFSSGVQVTRGVLEDDSAALMRAFFVARRQDSNNRPSSLLKQLSS